MKPKTKKPKKAKEPPKKKEKPKAAGPCKRILRAPGEPLRNATHEAFAQEVAKGDKKPVIVYEELVGTKGKVAATMASRWLKKVEIGARIQELQKKAAERTGLTIEKKLESLEQIFFAKPSEAAHDHPLSEMKMSKAGPYFAFPDKLKALELHAKLSGDLIEKVEHSGEVMHVVLTEERRAQLVEKKRLAIERARGALEP